MKEEYIVLGAGGHAKVALDILKLNNMNIYGLTDVNYCEGAMCMDYPIVGTDEVLNDLYQMGIRNAVMGIGHVGNPHIRNRVYHNTKELGLQFPNVIHPTAVVADSVVMGDGNLVAAQSILNPEASIGSLCIINSAAVVEHEVVIGDGVHIAPNATVLGMAHIGDDTFVGAGSVILQGVNIGKNCVIGAGAVVLKDVPDNSVIIGNPGRLLKRR